jgi:hypothetical protein
MVLTVQSNVQNKVIFKEVITGCFPVMHKFFAAEFAYPILQHIKEIPIGFIPCLSMIEKICKDYLGAVKFSNIFSLDVELDYKGEIWVIDIKTLQETGRMIKHKKMNNSINK